MDHDVPRKKILLWGQVEALCDTETDEGGWVIIQRRTKGDVNFYKPWADYSIGFGIPNTDYWLGLVNIQSLISRGYTLLRIDMEHQGKKYFALYSNFSVADEASKYKLTVGNYSETAGDALSYHNDMYFSTYDRDNDNSDSRNCATNNHGAWWFNECRNSNLNGVWGGRAMNGLVWFGVRPVRGPVQGSVSLSEMKVRYV